MDGTSGVYYYLWDDPKREIFYKDTTGGVTILPALAVVGTTFYAVSRAKAKADENQKEFQRKIIDEILKSLEIVGQEK